MIFLQNSKNKIKKSHRVKIFPHIGTVVNEEADKAANQTIGMTTLYRPLLDHQEG